MTTLEPEFPRVNENARYKNKNWYMRKVGLLAPVVYRSLEEVLTVLND